MMKKICFCLFAACLLLACKQDKKSATTSAGPASDTASSTVKVSRQGALKIGDTLYVHTLSGMALRKTPSKDGAKIATVPCNAAPLIVLELPDPANRYVAEKFGSFEVAGGWVKVRTVDGQEGYLFEGYLSRYPPAIESPEQEDSNLEGFYRIISPRKGPRDSVPMQPGMIEGYKQAFEDGSVFQFEYYQGGVAYYFYLPEGKMTMQEALVLFRPLWFQGETTGEYDAATQTLTISDVEGYQQMSIQPKDGQLVLEFTSAD